MEEKKPLSWEETEKEQLAWEKPSKGGSEKVMAIMISILFGAFVYLYLKEYKKFFTFFGVAFLSGLFLLADFPAIVLLDRLFLLGMYIYVLLDVIKRKY